MIQSRAEDRTQPTIQTMIGGLFFSADHSYIAESSVFLPILHSEPFSLSYQQHEVTPVLREHSQTQLLNSRYQLVADYGLGESARLIAVGGYQRTANEDRAGSLDAWEIGGGIGSPIGRDLPRLEWSAVAGGYVSPQRLDANWWADLHLVWRTFEFDEGQMMETPYKPWLGLAADINSANDGKDFNALYQIGPVLEIISGNGNRLRFRAQWYANDGNPFYETSDSAMLLGVEVNASLDKDTLYDARDHRPLGILPLVWGEYDVGYGGDRTIQRTALNAEIHDFTIADHVFTPVLWYESRQEYRTYDFDNVSYSVSFGVQTRIGLASFMSQGQPLVTAVEYLHRSAHSLAPDASRVPPPTVLPHDSINLARVRLQTLGWDLPYRDPAIYRAKSEWLNNFDWRVALGYDFHHSRDRPNPALQFGLNWDVASLQGFVPYARGVVSVGNDTPDWQVEGGFRRRAWKVFVRWEAYGLESDLARGNTLAAGVGFVL